MTLEGEDLGVRAPDSDRVTQVRIPNAIFAAPLRGTDGRDEIVAVARTDDATTRTWLLFAFRYDGTHLVKVVDGERVYRLTAANARWIGSDLQNLDLALSLTSRPDAIEVGGLLTARIGDKLRDLVVISPVHISRRRAKSASPEASDAGTTR